MRNALFGGRVDGAEVAHHQAFVANVARLAHHLEGLARLCILGLRHHQEGPVHSHRAEITVDTVGQAALVTHLLAQGRDQRTAAKDMITDVQRHVVGVMARDAALPDIDMGL